MKPYYEHAGIRIYHGDSREIVTALEPHSIDLVLDDPPFFMPANVSNCRRTWRRSLGDLGVMFGYFRDAFTEEARALKETGAFYCFGDAISFAIFHLLVYPLFDRTQVIPWYKKAGGLGNGWRHSNELILHGAWSETVYDPGFRVDTIGVVEAKTVPSAERWHQSEKPREVWNQLLGAHPVGLMLDPHMGAGSSLQAAKALGWRAIGVDVDESNCAEAARRLEQEVLPFAAPKPQAVQEALPGVKK